MTPASVIAALFPEDDGPGTTVLVCEEVPLAGPPSTLTIRHGQCRWPLWPTEGATPRSPEEQLYCGEPTDPTLENCAWCGRHRRLSRRGPEVQRRWQRRRVSLLR